MKRIVLAAFAALSLAAPALAQEKAAVLYKAQGCGDKPRIIEPIGRLLDLGFKIIATSGTQRFLEENGLSCAKINKVLEGRPHIVDAIKNGEVQLVFNTTDGAQAISDSRSLRRAALLHKVPYYTTIAGATAVSLGIEALRSGTLEVRPLQSYFAPTA
jgi:carbamoyl-phosphate synthase large subunit